MPGIEITPVISNDKNIVRSYGNGGFVIGTEHFYSGSQVILPTRVYEWSATSASQITIDSLSHILQQTESIDILVIGFGISYVIAPHDLITKFRKSGIVIEWMTTGAACRTFNLLLGEDRRVAAAIIAV